MKVEALNEEKVAWKEDRVEKKKRKRSRSSLAKPDKSEAVS